MEQFTKKEKYSYEDLLKIIEILRSEKGCPWDRKQTHESLIPHAIEESYELVEAIHKKDVANLKEELGDVLLQVLLHAQISKEQEDFGMEEIVDGLAKKMVYRHPHVFGEREPFTSKEEVSLAWEELKKKEKAYQTTTEEMENIASALPALIRAQKVQKKAAKIGFNPEEAKGILKMIREELQEVEEEVKNSNLEALEEEIGDLLLTITNLSGFFKINAEFALTKAVEKFINRFRYIENSAFAMNKKLSQLTFEELDDLWKKAKR